MTAAAKEALACFSVPVFLAGLDDGARSRVTLHVARPRNRQLLQQEARTALGRAGIDAECRIRALDHGCLEQARSLQDVLKSFAHDAIIYDPTESVSHAQALLRCGQHLRAALGRALRGIYLEPESRILYLVCRREELSVDERLDKDRQGGVEACARSVIETWRSKDPAAFDLSVRLCLDVPTLPLVPVDNASLDAMRHRLPWLVRLHTGMIVGAMATFLGTVFSGAALADGSLPAVSTVNGKVSAEGGEGNAQSLGIVSGSLTAPVGHSFGVQFDATGGATNGNALWGVAGQGFWRDPGIGLVGGYVSHLGSRFGSPDTTGAARLDRYAVEGEAYLGQFTPSAAVGYQNMDSLGVAHTGAFGKIDLAWYPLDDLMLSGGGDLNPNKSLAQVEAEYQLGLAALPGLSLFAEAGTGGMRDSMAIAGFRFYFGPAKSLIRRHREDDPPSLLTGAGIEPSFIKVPQRY